MSPSDDEILPEYTYLCSGSASHSFVGSGERSAEHSQRAGSNRFHLESQPLDRELIAGIAEQKDSALRDVIHLHGSAILRSAVYTLGDAYLAEDVMQSVFIDLWQTPARFDSQRGSLRSFLLAQCHGKCIDLIRSRNARAARETKVSRMAVTSAIPIDHAVMLEHATTEVRRALDRLPRAERDVIELAFYGGHTYRRVAVLLGMPEGTVKARIRSALSHLHDTLCREESLNGEYASATPA